MQRLTGILLIAISAASFGTLAIFGRLLYADGLDTFTMLFLRFSFAVVTMTFLLLLRKESLPRGKILLQLIGMGALGYVGQSFSFLSAIKYASAGLVALLLYLYPMFVFMLSVIILREKVTWVKIVALSLALIELPAVTHGQLSGIRRNLHTLVIQSTSLWNECDEIRLSNQSSCDLCPAGVVYGI
jgi:drug/metabolite transporter (DMT)-like permease